MIGLTLRRCPSCGSVFAEHRCAGPYAVPTCECGHPQGSHHPTAKTWTWCSVWSPEQCPCKAYKEAHR